MRSLLLLLVAGLVGGADEWPQFRGNPHLTGVAVGPVPGEPKLLWTYDAGESIESSAAIAGQTVYVGVQSADLVAIDLNSGKLRWKYRAKGGIAESSPAVSEGIVYVGDTAGVLHAVNAADGKGRWTFQTGAEVRSSPVIVGDRLLFGSYDTNLYCLSKRTGKLLWKLTTGNYVHGTPMVSGGVVYVAGCDEVFRGIRLTDGQELFQFPAGGNTGASPALLEKWAFYGTFNNEVVGADLSGRRVAWRYRDPERQFPFYSSPAVAGDRIVIGGRDKLVHCVNAKTGKGIWTFATRARVDSSPVIAGDRVYVGSSDGRLYGLDLASGKKLWEFEAGSPLSASPAIAAGRMVIGSQDGRLYCFGQSIPATVPASAPAARSSR